ncbi:methyltransferase family protein [Erythrobacter sp.]|jgi:protein-S-isoprenylcysteine O-methyltransferase Ste14|uniref:methyltransferase family protein n=1 Tax=Erythrobacter sp. TaxID=1042 RepID=UPI002E9EC53F|nr:protein-S-isoprenylcysteine methyltransferase [Erythrobacter sp.]
MTATSPSIPARPQPAFGGQLPPSDVSSGVGLAGLLGLLVWILFCRTFPALAPVFGLPPEYGVLSGPYAALTAMVFTAGPMAIWSLLVDKVHLRPSTGLDWNLARRIEDVLPDASIKLVGLWATWAILAALYALCRWYWDGQYLFVMHLLGYALLPLVVLSVPYVVWLDRFMVNPRDATWHFGAALLGRGIGDGEAIKRHWRAWIIKAFFGAFMISILPAGFAIIVEADPAAMFGHPVEIAMFFITLLFVVDVQIGTVGYLFTLRPLDAHIRSGNPFLGGWLAALICYPPFVWGVIGADGQILSYESNVADWGHWLAGQPALLWGWAGLLVFLTAIYAWATVIFGIRFSNLTYRGVLTNGPYRFTRHPAYLSKNLFWWCSVMPFLVTSGSASDALRNTMFLLVVNAIYYWRARTEEAHLLAEDAKYGVYHAWMEQRGLITAPLARLQRAVWSRISSAKDERAAPGLDRPREPAE